MKYLAALLLLVVFPAYSQTTSYLQGFREVVDGKAFGYHSPLPHVNTSLLVRGRDDYKPIRWNSEVIPANYNQEYASFIWVFGMDVVADPVTFIVSVNDAERMRFTSSTESTTGIRTFEGQNGEELILNTTMLDRHKDQMGFAVLKLPITDDLKGKPLLMEVAAVPEKNNAWFMTYQAQIREGVEVYQNKVVARSEEGPMHSISIDVIHLGDPAGVKVTVGSRTTVADLLPGYNKIEMFLPKVDRKRQFSATVAKDGEKAIKQRFSLEPVREWEIFLVQHTHTDVGYTRPQTEILPEHLRYIDNALDYCDLTDDYPDDAKFRWTIENSWTVREYLENRPEEQVQRLLDRIREGRIEATGMFFNFSEIIDENTLSAQTRTIKMIEEAGIDVKTIMQNDVNGIAWCLVDQFEHTDVKYLTMGIHAHRARKPFNKPTSFWWRSPAGNRLLAYRSEHYQQGNTLALTTGQLDVLRTNISNYLASLEDRKYPYNKLSLQFSGYVTDNSPPSPKACDIIREWNEKYEWPKLRSALAREFMMYLDEEHHEDIPEKEVAWPDWWTDGVASAANETKVVRNTQVELGNTTALLAMGKILGTEIPEDMNQQIQEVYDDLLFYHEHTFGAAESIRDPRVMNAVNQWNMKAAYAWDAARRSSLLLESAMAFIEPAVGHGDAHSMVVFNTLNWERSGIVYQFIENEVIPEGRNFRVVDEDGNNVPFQRYESRPEGTYFGLWVKDIPAFGYKTFRIEVGNETGIGEDTALDNLENEFYRIEVDPEQGVISSIYDKELDQQLLDPSDTLTLGQVIYEQLADRHTLERLTSTTRDTVYRPIDMTRTMLENVRIIERKEGQVYDQITLAGDLPVCTDERGVNLEIRLYHFEKKIELLYRMWKLPVFEPEGVYVSFPFKLENGELAFEAQGGVVYPGRNQLEGTASDWNTIQGFASVRNSNSQIVLGSKDVPRVHFGDLNIGRYYYRLNPRTNHIYSWVMNNYWVTNFKASQEGEFRWQYSITSGPDNSDNYATQIGWSDKTPFVSRIIQKRAGAPELTMRSRSLANISIPGLLLVNTRLSTDQEGLIFQFREVEGGHARLNISELIEQTGAASASEVSVLEEKVSDLVGNIEFDHHETKFILLEF